jgi:hypothetical protein
LAREAWSKSGVSTIRGENARALVISKYGLIQATMDDAGIVLRTQRASRRVIDPDSLSAGHSAGNNASFNRPVNGGGPTLLSGTLPD